MSDADDWIACNLGEERYGDCAVLVRVSTTGYTPVQVRFSPANQVMFVQPGTFLYRGNDPIASDPAVSLPLSSARREIVVARRGRRIDLWVDRRRALATDQIGSIDAGEPADRPGQAQEQRHSGVTAKVVDGVRHDRLRDRRPADEVLELQHLRAGHDGLDPHLGPRGRRAHDGQERLQAR